MQNSITDNATPTQTRPNASTANEIPPLQSNGALQTPNPAGNIPSEETSATTTVTVPAAASNQKTSATQTRDIIVLSGISLVFLLAGFPIVICVKP